MYVCMCVCVCVRACVRVYVCMYVCKYTCMHACMYVCINTCKHMHKYISIYTYTIHTFVSMSVISFFRFSCLCPISSFCICIAFNYNHSSTALVYTLNQVTQQMHTSIYQLTHKHSRTWHHTAYHNTLMYKCMAAVKLITGLCYFHYTTEITQYSCTISWCQFFKYLSFLHYDCIDEVWRRQPDDY